MALLTTTEAARYLGITQRQLRRVLGHGRIQRAVAGPTRRDWRFHPEELDRWFWVWCSVRRTKLPVWGRPLPEGGYLAHGANARAARIIPHPGAWTVEYLKGYGDHAAMTNRAVFNGPRAAMRAVDVWFQGNWSYVRWRRL